MTHLVSLTHSPLRAGHRLRTEGYPPHVHLLTRSVYRVKDILPYISIIQYDIYYTIKRNEFLTSGSSQEEKQRLSSKQPPCEPSERAFFTRCSRRLFLHSYQVYLKNSNLKTNYSHAKTTASLLTQNALGSLDEVVKRSNTILSADCCSSG